MYLARSLFKKRSSTAKYIDKNAILLEEKERLTNNCEPVSS